MMKIYFDHSHGFTLIEVVVVIVITGILLTVAMKTGTQITASARTEETLQELDHLAIAIVGDPNNYSNGLRTEFGYVGDVGSLPPNLDALITNPGGYATWNGPYIDNRFVQITSDYKKDAWQTDYQYTGGVSISSTGSGETISREFAGSTNDLMYNTIFGNIYDLDGTPPGNTYKDSISIRLTFPNGSGATTTKSTLIDAGGYFIIDSIPIGNHDLMIVYEPNDDTLRRFVSVLPGSDTYGEHRLSENVWFASGGSVTIPGLTGYWMLNETSGITAADSSGNNNDGTLHNMNPVTDWVTGKVDGALDFDGINDNVDVTLAGNSVTNLSFVVWFNSDDGASIGNNYVAQRFITQPRSSIYSRIAFGINSGKLSAYWYDGWYRVGEGTANVSAGVWTHGALTYDGASIKIYLNGAEVGSFAESNLRAASSDLFQIGQQASGERRFDGRLDDVRIYNRALDASEIITLYNMGN